MPKKTAYSRSGAQRSKSKPKSFELVRPVSTEIEPKSSVEESDADVLVAELDEKDEVEQAEEEEQEEVVLPQKSVRKSEKALKTPGAKKEKVEALETVAKTEVKGVSVAEPEAKTVPGSAASRMAARKASRKADRPAASLILAENYSYVRKDLLFILVLALIMFAAIVVMHFIPAIGG